MNYPNATAGEVLGNCPDDNGGRFALMKHYVFHNPSSWISCDPFDARQLIEGTVVFCECARGRGRFVYTENVSGKVEPNLITRTELQGVKVFTVETVPS